MNKTLIQKYRPKTFDDFFLNKENIDLFNTLIDTNMLLFLLCGSKGSGKTTILNIIINKYYKNCIENDNILYINNLQEKGINYYRNEVNTFCKNLNMNGKLKKTIVIDDIDLLSQKKQQIFRHFLDNYSNKVNFLFTCNNLQNVIECIQTRLYIFSLPDITKKLLKIIYYKIKKNENLKISLKAETNLFRIVNNSINQLINYAEKFKLIDEKITNSILKNICTNLSFFYFKEYTKAWYINKDFKKSMKIIINIYYKGYSIIDIFEFYFKYVKNSIIIDDDDKFKIIKIISKYIIRFYNLQERYIELYFLTNDLIFNIHQLKPKII